MRGTLALTAEFPFMVRRRVSAVSNHEAEASPRATFFPQ
jgi:hypothetical protein